MEHQNGVHQIAHEYIGTDEEEPAIEFHAGSEKLRIVSFISLRDIDFAFEAVCVVEAQIVEYHSYDAGKNDLLHDFHTTLHRVSLEAELVSADQKSHLGANSGLRMFQTIEDRRWQFDLGMLLIDEVANSLFVLGIEESELAQVLRRFRETDCQDPHVGVCRIRELG